MITVGLRAPSLPPYDADLVRAALDRLDHTARTMERKWGVGRLRLLVDDILRAKFDRQAKLLDGVLWTEDPNARGDSRTILAQIDAMERGWRKLDAVAGVAHVPKPSTWIECVAPAGQLFVVVPDNADASLLDDQLRGRAASVYTAAEVGRLLEAWPQVATAKAVFPGATVTEIRSRRAPDWEVGDDLPF